MTCHRALAQVDGPMQAAFSRIADQLEKELAAAEASARQIEWLSDLPLPQFPTLREETSDIRGSHALDRV
jgi:hypothetical protein